MDTKRLLNAARELWLEANLETPKPSTVVIKLTQDCNLRCIYCYTQGGKYKNRISVETVNLLLDQLVKDNPSTISCIFHGGEPLLAVDLMEEIILSLKAKYYGPRLDFKIQTNGTLLNDKVIELLKKHNVQVGVSIDGPKFLNDKTRVHPDGRSSYAATERGIKALRAAGLNFGVLCLVTKHNVTNLVDILSWCADHGIRGIAFGTFTPMGYGVNADLAPDLNDLWFNTKKAICWLIEYNRQASACERIYEREIAAFVRNIVYPGNHVYMCASIPCGAGTRCIGLDVNGDLLVCDSFYGDPNYVIGNIHRHALEVMLRSPIIEKLAKRSRDSIVECRNCEVKEFCSCGCPAENVSFLGPEGLSTKSRRCTFFKQVLKYLRNLIEEDALDPSLLCDYPREWPGKFGDKRKDAKI